MRGSTLKGIAQIFSILSTAQAVSVMRRVECLATIGLNAFLVLEETSEKTRFVSLLRPIGIDGT